MELEQRIDTIDVEKLKVLMAEGPLKQLNQQVWEKGTIYLGKKGRLDSGNAMMAMSYQGRGLFMFGIGDWHDYDIDPESDFVIAQGSKNKSYGDFLEETYSSHSDSPILVAGASVDTNIVSAISAYAAMSNYFVANGIEFNPIEVRHPRNELGLRFPQQLLDLTQHADGVKQQLLDYIKV